MRTHNLRLTWQFPIPSHEEGQGLCFQNAADPTSAYTSLQQTSFLGCKLVQSQWSDPWNAQYLLSSKDQHTSDLNINKVVGNIQLTEQSGNWKLRESLPGDVPGDETPTPRRGRDAEF